MAVKRRTDAQPYISDEAVTAFKAGDWLALQRALRLPPWHCSPLDADPDGPPPDPDGPPNAWEATWADAATIRRKLDRLASQ